MFTLHLFAGAGGGILGDALLGHRCVGAVELDPYAQACLLARQADGLLEPFPIWDDITTFSIDNAETRPYIQKLREVSKELAICGGFP